MIHGPVISLQRAVVLNRTECFSGNRVLAQALELLLACFDLCSSQQTSSVLGTLVGLGCIIARTARTCRCLTRKLVLLLQCWSGLNFSALVKAAELASIRETAALVLGLRCTSLKFVESPLAASS